MRKVLSHGFIPSHEHLIYWSHTERTFFNIGLFLTILSEIRTASRFGLVQLTRHTHYNINRRDYVGCEALSWANATRIESWRQRQFSVLDAMVTNALLDLLQYRANTIYLEI